MTTTDSEKQIIPLTGLRGAIARNMALGWSAPRVAHSVEADISACEILRVKLQSSNPEVKISVNAILMRALALTLKNHPRLNAFLKDSRVELIDEVNLGMAVSLDDGLMVPVIRNADQKSVVELAMESKRLADGARTGGLTPGNYQKGTFTVSNLGMTGIDSFTPIINPPQVAILGITRAIDKPVVRNKELVIRKMLGLHLVFDHRAVDGYPAAVFLSDLVNLIESADFL